ncbi:hypothetical protein CEP54_009995 [Fusarium duplospermum]|uniref:Actin-like ATPase domain-containing protein n=1 Tax=Fusarium duplospermum TaxID=1325734 RepID=A0A428PMG2_9HYPO|nr:hypothetical protein CEP54_009995 [Fusarium duplospermum]
MPSSLSSVIIVGIDFGTTYSGVSWAINEGHKRIRLITDWPNPSATNANADKVPSLISYQNGRVANWGYEVGIKEEAFRWVKILLEPKSKYSEEQEQIHKSTELLAKLNKTAEEVIGDYLGQIWEYTKEDIRKRVGDNDWQKNFELHVVLTVPAMWSHVAKDRTLKAARRAGLPEDIHLVTEPEAAALATLHDKAEENSLTKGDAFVVCDAGGGTVDLISYKVNSASPLEIEECAIGDGDLCGSTKLDEGFEKHIAMLVGECQYSKIKDIHKKKMMRTFESGVKRCFAYGSNKEYSVELRGVEDNLTEGIEEETIILDPSTLKTLFGKVCGQIDNLVQNQIEEVVSNGLQVKAILLVGGFGSSKYLHHRLECLYSLEGITVLQVDGAWSSICRGACRWGLDYATQQTTGSASSVSPAPTITGRISKYSYGVRLSVPFDDSQHLLADRFLDDASNKYYAANQMIWLLRRGERVNEGRVLSTKMFRSIYGIGVSSNGKREFDQPLFYCQDNEPPTRLTDSVKKLCSVNFSVDESKIWLEETYKSKGLPGDWRNMKMELSLILGNATLGFMVKYRDDSVGTVEAKYMEDSS